MPWEYRLRRLTRRLRKIDTGWWLLAVIVGLYLVGLAQPDCCPPAGDPSGIGDFETTPLAP